MTEDSRNPWQTLDSRVVYANSWMSVREDSVIRPDGRPGIYGVVLIRPSVGILAIDNSKRLALEIPTGGSEEGESLLLAAQRELAEKAGLEAAQWTPLGSIDNSNGVTTDVSHIFLASGLVPLAGGQRHQGDEEIELVWMPFAGALERVLGGEITESVSVAGILKAALQVPELR